MRHPEPIPFIRSVERGDARAAPHDLPSCTPFSEGELVRAAVPEDRADLLGRSAADHDRQRRFPRQDHVQTCGACFGFMVATWASCLGLCQWSFCCQSLPGAVNLNQ